MIHDPQKLAEQSARIGMVINLMLPAGVALLAYAIEAAELAPKWEMAQADPPIIFFLFGALAISELAAAFIIRKKFFARDHVAPFRNDGRAVEQWLMRSSIIVFALGAAPMLYGAVLYIVSGELRQFAFFGIVTLLAYRLFRPSADLLEEILQTSEQAL
jgi:hypothetical protein